MIIRREALKAALVATTADDSRYYLHSVQISPDGTVEATNGHMLVRVHDKAQYPDTDFPQVPGGVIDGALSAPVLLSADHAARLIAATPKKSPIPILGSIQIGTQERGNRVAVATDLSVPCVINLEATNTEQTFPSTDRVMVKEGQRPAVIKLVLAAEMLVNLAKIATTVGRKGSENAITFEIPTEAVYQGTKKDEDGKDVPNGEINSAVRVTMDGHDLSVEGVVMPCSNG